MTGSRSAQTLKVAVISEGTSCWPLYAAEDQRTFEREGIAVEVTVTGSSARQLEALRAGGFDIGFQQADHIVRAVEQGSDLFIFMAQAHAPELTLVATPVVNSFADLKRGVVAVDGARTGYALLLRKLLADKGIGPGDCSFVEFGGVKERSDALKNGAAVASFLNPPFDRNLLASGFRSMGTTAEYFPDYPGPIAAARREWARQHGDSLVAFIRGFRAAYSWLCDARNKQQAIRLLPPRLNMSAEGAARAYDQMAARALPHIRPEQLRQVIDVVWEAEGYGGQRGAPEKYLDSSFLECARP
jgi:ABC-type nitrate/sulfonate/bicarbonate transport system substrate-binding protein